MASATDNELLVSDHALLRWMERVYDIDIDGIRAQLAELARPMSDSGAQSFVHDGHEYVFRAGRLVTVLDTSARSRRLTCRLRDRERRQ
jgi:hypothetical protein